MAVGYTTGLLIGGALLFAGASWAASDAHHEGQVGQGHEAAHADQADPEKTTASVGGAIPAAELYLQYCSVCHGDTGNGRSRARGGLVPPPKDFTTPKAAAELSRERMIRSVAEGRPGTAMSGWSKRLSAREIEAIVDYIRNHFMVAATTERENTGRRIFAEYCSVCHGDRGQGAVWAMSGLKPPPANFTDPTIQQQLSRTRMIFSVTYGRPQTAMAAWGKRLSAQEIESVVDYVRGAIMKIDDAEQVAASDRQGHGGGHGDAGAHDHDAHGADNIMDPLPGGLVGDFTRGEELYEQNCTACHGAKGDGHGPRAYFIFPKPRDFRHPAAQAKYSRPHLFEVISKGELGTEMPAWDKVLNRAQIADLAEYVFRSFIRPDAGS